MMLLCDGQKFVHAFEETLWILFPKQIMQENAHAVEADLLRPAEFAVNRLWIKRICLPHLQLVDRCAGGEVAADEPAMLGLPFICFLDRPRRLRKRGKSGKTEQEAGEVFHMIQSLKTMGPKVAINFFSRHEGKGSRGIA